MGTNQLIRKKVKLVKERDCNELPGVRQRSDLVDE